MFLNEDSRVNREPVREEDEERVEPGFEVVVTGQGENDVDDGANDAEEESRDELEVFAERLEG